MRIDPNAPLQQQRRYLVSFVDDGATYQFDEPDELMRDLFPTYDAAADPSEAQALRSQLAQHLALNFAMRQEYGRASGRYSGPELRVFTDQDAAAPAGSDEHTVVLNTSSAAGLLDSLAAAGIIQWIDLDKVFSSGEPSPWAQQEQAEEFPAETATQPDIAGEYGGAGPWRVSNPRGRSSNELQRLEQWLSGHPQLDQIKYELVFDGGKQRGFALDWVELCELLMPGYLAADPGERAQMRLRFTAGQQVSLQAQILASLSPEQRAGCTLAELELLRRTEAATPSPISQWNAPAPLVLLNWQFAPYTDQPPPRSRPRNGAPENSNLWWIIVDDEESLLKSLANLGLVGLGRFSRRRARQVGQPVSQEQNMEGKQHEQ